MTIAQAFNEITVAQGGTPNGGGTITGAIDALNDTLAGSDQAQGRTIEDAVRLLGQHIGVGSSVTVEALTATENKTYTAPEGKAYSPVIVNVSGGGENFNHATMPVIAEDENFDPIPSEVDIDTLNYKDSEGNYISIDFTTTTYTYDDGYITPFETTAIVADLPVGYPIYAWFPNDNLAHATAWDASISDSVGCFAVFDSSEYGNAVVVLKYETAPI